MRITHITDIASPPTVVWHYLTDPEQQKLWMKGLVENELVSEGEPKAGGRFRMKIREGRRVADYDGEFTRYEPPRFLGIRFWGGAFAPGMAILCDYELEPQPGGTRLRYDTRLETARLSIWMRLAMPLFKLFGRMQSKAFMRRLKALAENGGVATGDHVSPN